MSKYIIELGEDANMVQIISVTQSGNVYIDSTVYVEYLERLNSDYINEHFGDLQDTAYQRGLNDAWEAARKVALNTNDGGLSFKKLDEIFDCYTLQQVFKEYTAKQTIEKLKAYEEKQKADEDVKRGDVVRHKNNGLTYIVTLANECGYVLLDGDGNFATSCITNIFEKTGKHFDIASILEEMKHD